MVFEVDQRAYLREAAVRLSPAAAKILQLMKDNPGSYVTRENVSGTAYHGFRHRHKVLYTLYSEKLEVLANINGNTFRSLSKALKRTGDHDPTITHWVPA